MPLDQIKRRDFITLLGGAATAWPLAARAQQATNLPTIGILASLPLPPFQRFAWKLRDYGYVEGQSLRLVSRFAEGRDDLYPLRNWPRSHGTQRLRQHVDGRTFAGNVR
jgi:hypothetical protein